MDDDLRNRFRRDFSHKPPKRRTPAASPERPASSSVINQVDTDHGRQPQASPPQPLVSFDLPDGVKPHPQHKSHKKLYLIIIIVLLLGSGAGGAYWYKFVREVVPIPATFRSSLSYPLLYPASLPTGYQIKQSSFNTTQQGPTTFEADNQSNGRIEFSVEKTPSNFNFSAFY